MQLDYRFEDILISFGWGYASYDPPREDLQYEVKKRYFAKYVHGGIEPGEYRMVIFAGPRIIYVPFRFVTPEEYAEKYASK